MHFVTDTTFGYLCLPVVMGWCLRLRKVFKNRLSRCQMH